MADLAEIMERMEWQRLATIHADYAYEKYRHVLFGMDLGTPIRCEELGISLKPDATTQEILHQLDLEAAASLRRIQELRFVGKP